MRVWHDLVYRVTEEICYDKEYVYASFLRTFEELSHGIYREGGVSQSGRAQVNGIKSDDRAVYEWTLLRRVDYVGHNEFRLHCTIENRFTGQMKQSYSGVFDVATGQAVESAV